MKILTKTTTVRLPPDVYERVLFIAHRERKHPTSVMREAITSSALSDTETSQAPDTSPTLTHIRAFPSTYSSSEIIRTEPVCAVVPQSSFQPGTGKDRSHASNTEFHTFQKHLFQKGNTNHDQ